MLHWDGRGVFVRDSPDPSPVRPESEMADSSSKAWMQGAALRRLCSS
uniref:Uncharacterized protein n=1 Tax=Anguilla anguilla TaxID=7936 RepID=A0A0E9TUI0_ANGAN